MTRKELNFLDKLFKNGFDWSNVTIVVEDTVLHDAFEQEVRDESQIAKAGVYVWHERVYDFDNKCYLQADDQISNVYNSVIYYYSFRE